MSEAIGISYSLLECGFMVFAGTGHGACSGVSQPGKFGDYACVEDLVINDKAGDVHLHWELVAIPCNTMYLGVEGGGWAYKRMFPRL